MLQDRRLGKPQVGLHARGLPQRSAPRPQTERHELAEIYLRRALLVLRLLCPPLRGAHDMLQGAKPGALLRHVKAAVGVDGACS